MRRYAHPITVLIVLALTGCTMIDPSPDSTPLVITATLSEPVVQALTPTSTLTETPAPPSPPSPEATLITLLPPTSAITTTPAATQTPPVTPSPPPTLAPTRTAAALAQPLDDGSGRLIAGTSGDTQAAITGGAILLPESLYFLAPDAGGANQVFRLRAGLPSPEQVTLSATGVSAYDLAPDGALAYITPQGLLLANGIPVLPPTDNLPALPQATALAWAPLGGWLVFTLQTPGAQVTAGPHAVDGVWLRSTDGSLVRLATNDYTPESPQIFAGPLRWSSNSAAVLVRDISDPAHLRWSVVSIAGSALTPLWNNSTLKPGAFTDAFWSADGATVLGSGAGRLLRITPTPLSAQVLLDRSAGFAPSAAQPRADGAIVFTGQREGGPVQLYALLPGQSTPIAQTDGLIPAGTAPGTVEALWDSSGTQAVIVTAAEAAAQTTDSASQFSLIPAFGAPTLRDSGSIRHDLSTLTGGLIAGPQWAPLFKVGDRARVQSGEPLNLRGAPNGTVIAALNGGVVVTVRDGPRVIDGVTWWQVQTSERLTGWVVDTLRDNQGQTVRTLLPIP